PVECIFDGQMLPLFLAGNSLGGGLAACMVLQRPSFFKGVLLLCPMLTVSDEVKPPWIVQMIFKYVVAHLFPTWPVSPVKDLSDFDFRDPLQGNKYVKVNPMSLQGLTPRLGTSLQLGFIYPDWLKERLSEVRTPFIIQHGLEDRVTDPNTSKELYKEAIAKDKTLKLYDGVYHCEMFCCLPGNEKLLGLKWSPEQVAVTKTCLEDMKQWMAERIGS
ncbi:Caffeoylshikimate esterase (Lysophospholipase 2) (LysoPL2), partial [Durusdinium trenchii]